MSNTIPVAHDFICPWCYVALLQTERLHKEFGVDFEWMGYELMPEDLPWPEPAPPSPEPLNRPKTPSRLDYLVIADDIEMPKVERPKRMRTHLALLATEFAKEKGKGGLFVAEVYRALWERGEYINEIEFLTRTGEKLGLDPAEMRQAIEEERHDDKIVKFDAQAYSVGVYNVPTYFIGEERYAEQPYRTLAKAIAEAQVNA